MPIRALSIDVIENVRFTGSKIIQVGRVPQVEIGFAKFDGSESKYPLYLTGVVGTRRSEGFSAVPF